MITLRKKPYVDTLSLTDMMTFDKANVIEHCKIANIDIPQRWRKAEIGEALRDIFFHDPHWTIRLLSDEEITMLKQLLSLNVDEYITYPRDDTKYLLMQKLHLVVTYEAPTKLRHSPHDGYAYPLCLSGANGKGARSEKESNARHVNRTYHPLRYYDKSNGIHPPSFP